MKTSLVCMLLVGFLLVSLHETEGRPNLNRRKRQSEDEYQDDEGFIDDEDDGYDEVDSNYLRDTRRIGDQPSTFPPFPGYDEYDYDKYSTEGPETAPPLITPTTEKVVYPNRTDDGEETGKPFHKKVGHWFKKHWGKTKDFFSNLGK